MDERASRAQGAPPDQVRIAIVTVPKTGVLTVRFLGPILGTITHWVGGIKGHSVACTGDRCPRNAHESRQIWKGYAACEWIRSVPRPEWIPAVIEVTENLYFVIGTTNPRGETWQLSRSKVGHDRAECRGVFVQRTDPKGLRLDVQVEPAVQRLYRTMHVLFGATPPFGDRQALEPRPASIPDGAPPAEVQAPLPGEQIREMLAEGRKVFTNGKATHKNGKTSP